MDEIAKFWWGWWVQFGIAFGTIAAVIMAMFGDRIRAAIFKPSLTLSLSNAEGEASTNTVSSHKIDKETGEVEVHESDPRNVWYFFGIAAKGTRSPILNDVVVSCIKVELTNLAGHTNTEWQGEVPVGWREQRRTYLAVGTKILAIPYVYHRVGIPREFKIIEAMHGKWVEIAAPSIPRGSEDKFRWRTGPVNITVHLRAKSLETASNVLKVKITWTGKWPNHVNDLHKELKLEAVK